MISIRRLLSERRKVRCHFRVAMDMDLNDAAAEEPEEHCTVCSNEVFIERAMMIDVIEKWDYIGAGFIFIHLCGDDHFQEAFDVLDYVLLAVGDLPSCPAGMVVLTDVTAAQAEAVASLFHGSLPYRVNDTGFSVTGKSHFGLVPWTASVVGASPDRQ